MAEATSEPKKYGTFGGVFTPTLLTILGVIMYLREGWVVGNAGIGGGLLIIVFAFGITGLTALSMSSITTNIRIGAGGAYSIISQSLGLEVGGSVGIPLYLSQTLAVAMYVFGFREGWAYVFPGHPALAVDLIVFGVLAGIAYRSAGLAFRVQYVIMAIIAASLLSVAMAAAGGSMEYAVTDVGLWGDFSEGDFWVVFGIFFPAATGIMAGANMSGDLKDPRRSIPVGTLSAIGVSLLIYVALAYWLARSATPEELVGNYTVMIDKAFWGPPVLAGLLGATFSSGLSSLVGAPRILQALGDHRILPAGRWIAQRTESGEPRNAMLVTIGIAIAALMLRDLNAVAPLITMFFLITYTMINVVVFIEQSLGLVSFRPLLRIPRLVSFLGMIGCLFAMFVVNATFGLFAVALVIGFYSVLVRRRLNAPFGDVRSGLFVSLAEWAAKKVQTLPGAEERTWKANLLAPVRDASELRGTFLAIEQIAYPKGSVHIFGISPRGTDRETLEDQLMDQAIAFRERGIYAASTVVDAPTFADGLVTGMQTMTGAFFRPNALFLQLEEEVDSEDGLGRIIDEAPSLGIGVLLHVPHQRAGLGRRERVNVWAPHPGDRGWGRVADLGDLNLALLVAYKLATNWTAKLRLLAVVADEEERAVAEAHLRELRTLARIPDAAVTVGIARDRFEYMETAPQADVTLAPLPEELQLATLRRFVERSGASAIFVRGSGSESALA